MRQRPIVPLLTALMLVGACAGKPAAPPVADAVGGSVSSKLRHLVNLAGVARVPAKLLTDAGAGIISEHGGGLIGKVKRTLLAEADLVPVPRAKVTALDGSGAPVPGVKPTTTDEQGAYTLHDIPAGAIVEVHVETPGLVVSTLDRPDGSGTPANLSPATTLVTASLRRGVGNLGQLPIARFHELVDDVQDVLATTLVELDLKDAAAAAESYDRVAAARPAIKAKEEQAAEETRKATPILSSGPPPSGGLGPTSPPAPVFASVAPATPTPQPAPEATPTPEPNPSPGATPTPAPAPVPSPSVGGVSTLAGSSAGFQDGPAPLFSGPAGIAVAPNGDVYVADTANHCIRKLTAGGTASTFAGVAGSPGYINGTGAGARFNTPRGLAYDPVNGVLLVADTGNHCIRFISNSAQVGDLAGPQAPTVASGFADGTQVNARFNGPTAVAFASSSVAYVADTGNNCIRRIDVGVTINISTVAGAQTAGYLDGNGTAARFNRPTGVAVDGGGAIYVADAGNNRIREIDPTNAVSSFAGDGTAAFTPRNLAARANGTLVVTVGDRLVNVSTTGQLSPFTGGASGFLDGLLSAAKFSAPDGVAIGGSSVYTADTGNHRIRKITP